MMTSKERAELRAQANTLDVTLIVGKGGISETLLAEAVVAAGQPRAGQGPRPGDLQASQPARRPTPSARRWAPRALHASARSS